MIIMRDLEMYENIMEELQLMDEKREQEYQELMARIDNLEKGAPITQTGKVRCEIKNSLMEKKFEAIMDEVRAISATFKAPAECNAAIKNLDKPFPEAVQYTDDEDETEEDKQARLDAEIVAVLEFKDEHQLEIYGYVLG